MEEKPPLSYEVMSFQMLEFEANSNIVENHYFFLKNYVTSEGAVSQNVLYYSSPLLVQVSFDRC